MDIGAQLRAAREAKGLSIGTLAERTRVPARALAAIELNDRSSLPPHPFGRGFVRTYAEEVDLDPEPLVREYFAQFPARRAYTPMPIAREPAGASWPLSPGLIGLGTAIAILLVVAVAASIVRGRRGDGPSGSESVGTTGVSRATSPPTSAAPGTVATPDRATAPPAGTPPAAHPPQSGTITVVLSMSRPCWVAATVDGHRTIYRVLTPAERETLTGERHIAIRFGDAGAVRWTINGRDAGAPGASGAVRDVHITPQNAASVR